jgi:uncharacterized membrane protein
MPEKRNKYDTDPLDPDFLRRTEELMGRTEGAPREDETVPLSRDPAAEEATRRFDEQISDAYPSVFVPPVYQPPPARAQPFTSFGAEHHPQPPAASGPPPPGPSTPYDPQAQRPPSSRPVTRLGIPENIANILPYAPFYIGLVAAVAELLIVPRHETRARFHAAQGFALQLAILAGSFIFGVVETVTDIGIGGSLFWLASFVFLLVSMWRVWDGKPHHIAPLDDATRWLNDRVKPAT